MIIVDRELERREAEGRPVRVGMVGAGFMGRGVARQLIRVVPGMRLVAVANRSLDGARRAFTEAGVEETRACGNAAEIETAVGEGTPAVTEDALALCAAGNLDVVVDVTGAVEFGARVALAAIGHGHHLCTMNVELDATVGTVLRRRAERAGVLLTVADGDQPGVQMNLVRYVRGMGLRPVLCGNIKGLHDPHRNPTTQADFARRTGQQAHMVTSFADGSKISMEQASVANAVGMRVGRRGMHGPTVEAGTPIADCVGLYPGPDLLEGPGIVDYVVGAHPAPGVYVFATQEDPVQREYLKYYKMGDGPLYCFHHPTHLCHLEVANSIARLACFGDVTLAAEGHHVDVVATAKTDLPTGTTLDGIGHYHTYGLCENAEVARRQNLLPLGLAEGCVLARGVAKDTVITRDDVTLPPGRLCDELRAEQDALPGGPAGSGGA